MRTAFHGQAESQNMTGTTASSLFVGTAMVVVKNGRVLFNQIPAGFPDPETCVRYDETEHIDLDGAALRGGVLLKTIALSIDPYMRTRMRERKIKGRYTPFDLGCPLVNYGIGRVLRSENPRIRPGEYVYHAELPFQEYSILPDTNDLRVINNELDIPWTAYVGVIGMTGQTAWYGWEEYAAPQPGETLFITAAAGAVGSFVIQLAKRDGLKVIASAGSEEKVIFARECGADVAFNYKTESMGEVLAREGPVNIYWDNVGGNSLNIALENSAIGARFILCGAISTLNGATAGCPNMPLIIAREIRVYGFLFYSLSHKYEEEFYTQVPRLVAAGSLKYKEDFKRRLRDVGRAIYDVQIGANVGKSVIALE